MPTNDIKLKYAPIKRPIHKTAYLLLIFLESIDENMDMTNNADISNIFACAIFAANKVIHNVTIADIPLFAPNKEFIILNIGMNVYI